MTKEEAYRRNSLLGLMVSEGESMTDKEGTDRHGPGAGERERERTGNGVAS